VKSPSSPLFQRGKLGNEKWIVDLSPFGVPFWCCSPLRRRGVRGDFWKKIFGKFQFYLKSPLPPLRKGETTMKSPSSPLFSKWIQNG